MEQVRGCDVCEGGVCVCVGGGVEEERMVTQDFMRESKA